MKRQAHIESIKSKITDILKRNGVVKAGIFGSFARGEENENSDIDILIEVKREKFSLLDMASLKIDLEETLGRKIDLLTYSAINPHLKEYILKDEVPIL